MSFYTTRSKGDRPVPAPAKDSEPGVTLCPPGFQPGAPVPLLSSVLTQFGVRMVLAGLSPPRGVGSRPVGPVMGLLPPGLSSLGPVLQTVGRAGEAILPVIPAGQRSELGLERSLPWCPSSGSRLAQPCPGQERRVPFFPRGSRIGDGGRSLRKRKRGCSFIMDAALGHPLERAPPGCKMQSVCFQSCRGPALRPPSQWWIAGL